jgi:FkbM family methyltransferase
MPSFFDHYIRCPLYGLLFDLKGGKYYRVNDSKFTFPRDKTTIGWRGLYFELDTYEIDERNLAAKHIKPEDAVIELGGSLGVVSCLTNRLLLDKKKHLIVEANPFLIPYLYRNRNLNHAKFIVENCFVGNPPEAVFYADKIVEGSAYNKTDNELRLPSRSMAELCERHGPFNVLHMDIEGGEYEVLRSSNNILTQFRLVIVEIHDFILGAEKVAACHDILESSGLKLLDQSNAVEVWQR